jgi:heterodisulfide reductase subunit C2
MVFSMDLLPNQIIRLVQLGLEEDISSSKTIWLCTSCLTCSVRCPRGVDLASVMEAIRLITLRKNVDYIVVPKISADTIKVLPQIALVSSFRKHTA